MNNETKALLIIVALMMSGATITSIFSTDSTAARIEACMTQPGMQYKNRTCTPIENK